MEEILSVHEDNRSIGQNTEGYTQVRKKFIARREAPFKNASRPFMRQRLCSNSGHHRVPPAIKSSSCHELYIDPSKRESLKSRPLKRGGAFDFAGEKSLLAKLASFLTANR